MWKTIVESQNTKIWWKMINTRQKTKKCKTKELCQECMVIERSLLFQSAWAVKWFVAQQVPRLSGLNSETFVAHKSWGWKQGQAQLVCRRALPRSLRLPQPCPQSEGYELLSWDKQFIMSHSRVISFPPYARVPHGEC